MKMLKKAEGAKTMWGRNAVGIGHRAGAIMAVFAATASWASMVHAQEVSEGTAADPAVNAALVKEIEKEADEASTEAGALSLAQAKAAQGDLTGAAAVLERYLLVDEEAVEPRAEYAVLLCRLDDVPSGQFEGAKLASEVPGSEALGRVKAACGGLADLSKFAANGEAQ
ncbi:hypothetical protein [Novosphingobium album (ex Hu et al. 2023)]|uniref:Tetratricopeptide repeat protein n=1 Tax=Novosphingobium album (ex Hu et al. 2023) TaxID=2930093 RepID=A0ABT0AZP5_9SPHN|nr:hypothetical protein [Novosphingobium album (ex Hu et al. 2023)]MCJ2178171.1 hypothetical protein [Novosphingobium album (ex Hu et al. 2023)]